VATSGTFSCYRCGLCVRSVREASGRYEREREREREEGRDACLPKRVIFPSALLTAKKAPFGLNFPSRICEEAA
jgi:hypothetical protein